jgi:hypothetical protein
MDRVWGYAFGGNANVLEVGLYRTIDDGPSAPPWKERRAARLLRSVAGGVSCPALATASMAEGWCASHSLAVHSVC